MTEPSALIKPTALGRFVVWLENAGYARCFDDRDLRGKEYKIRKGEIASGNTRGVLVLEGAQGSCEFYFNERGQLVGHEVLEWA